MLGELTIKEINQSLREYYISKEYKTISIITSRVWLVSMRIVEEKSKKLLDDLKDW